MPAIGRMRARAQASKTKAIINRIELALSAYEHFWGFYPPGGASTNLNDPAAAKTLYEYLCEPVPAVDTFGRGPAPAFIEPKGGETTVLSGDNIFVDGWKQPLYVYTANPGPLVHNRNACDIYSKGPDLVLQVNDTDDDGDGAIDEADEIQDDFTNWGYEN